MAPSSKADNNAYQLIDSGEGARLERLGEKLLIRPSSLCIWQRRNPNAWQSVAARFDPKKKRWDVSGTPFETWQTQVQGVQLILRLQDNGQVGFFPEHASYLPRVRHDIEHIAKRLGKAPQVLNLFAYTGMASLVALAAGAIVTHVEISKRALDWAQQNILANNAPKQHLRFIREDALEFLRKEVRREKLYDLVIADPPSFSRVSDKQSWELDTILPELCKLLVQVMNPELGVLYLTSHMIENGGAVSANLLRDYAPDKAKYDIEPLLIPETSSTRVIPAGQLVRMTLE
ncbi:MAG: class I SAM-dependent methyltransferase [Oligoflexia bacterium]|nr:class I SAM-dependent methyltransferase [Oligoflexia bacterium]